VESENATVKKIGRRNAGTFRLWYRRTYNLAPTDDRYLDATDQIIEAEYYSHFFDDLHQKGKLDDYVEDDAFDETLESITNNEEEWEVPDER